LAKLEPLFPFNDCASAVSDKHSTALNKPLTCVDCYLSAHLLPAPTILWETINNQHH